MLSFFRRREPNIEFTDKVLARHRIALIQNVRKTWIEGVLHNSLHHHVAISLQMEERPNSVTRPLPLDLLRGGEAKPLDVGTPIAEIFEDSSCLLLILGPSACGKTFTLLQLTEELLRKAERSSGNPIPIVLDLASWSHHRDDRLSPHGKFLEWIVERMRLLYQVPRPLARVLIREARVCLMLDGLDELPAGLRASCVRAINSVRDTIPIEMAVASRLEDYEALSQSLNFANAIAIRQLNPDQVDHYLAGLGPSSAGLRALVRLDNEWRQLACSPLALNLMALAFDGKTVAELAELPQQNGLQYLFGLFVHRGLTHARVPASKSGMLLNLAAGMQTQDLELFHIESLQPTWLPARGGQLAWQWRSGILVGISGGLLIGLFAGLHSGLSFGLILGIFNGLVGGLIVGADSEIEHILVAIPKPQPRDAAIMALAGAITWMAVSVWIGLLMGVFSGLLVALGVWLFLLNVRLNRCGSVAKKRTRPNDGTRESLVSALKVAAIFGLFAWLLAGLPHIWFYGFASIPESVIHSPGPVLAIIGGMLVGHPVVQHFVLRVMIARAGVLPHPLSGRRLVRFLDSFQDGLILQRIGGGWRFVHRGLREYLASLAADNPRRSASRWEAEVNRLVALTPPKQSAGEVRGTTSKTSHPIPKTFQVAFSFAGEQRALVGRVAKEVETALGKGTVFFDEWYEYWIAGDDADLRLREIYHKRAQLVVVCVSEAYGGKPWTQAEHRVIRALQMELSTSPGETAELRVLPLRVGDGDVPGILLNTVVPDIRESCPEETAKLILARLSLVQGEPSA